MQVQLEAVHRDLERALERVRRLAATRTNEEWIARPAEGSWSAAECIAHLNLTSEVMVPLLERGLEEARRLGGSGTGRLRRDLMGWLIWRAVRPETKMRTKTTAPFVPTGELNKEELAAEFERLQDALMRLVKASEGLPIYRVKVSSPFSDKVRYSVYSAFTVTAAHEHRHLDQAERAVERASAALKA